jgi:hypothetical protein
MEIALHLQDNVDADGTDADSTDAESAGKEDAEEDHVDKNREPSYAKMLQSLVSNHHISTADISCYSSLIEVYSRLRSVHQWAIPSPCTHVSADASFYV